jgi:hypothetical protein
LLDLCLAELPELPRLETGNPLPRNLMGHIEIHRPNALTAPLPCFLNSGREKKILDRYR